MNVTTIQIKWSETSDYYNAVNSIANTPLNTFENETIKATTIFDHSEAYTEQRQLTAMIRLDCHNRKRDPIYKYKRFLIWKFLKDKFGMRLTLERIGSITGHDHSTVTNGLRSIQNYLKYKDVQLIKDEVYQVCEEIFI